MEEESEINSLGKTSRCCLLQEALLNLLIVNIFVENI